MLIDSHCHLDFPDFASELDAVVGRAKSAGVGHMLTISTRVRKFDEVLAVAERFPEVTCSRRAAARIRKQAFALTSPPPGKPAFRL